MKLIREADDFTWINHIPNYISIYDVKVGEKYRVEATDALKKIINRCLGGDYFDITDWMEAEITEEVSSKRMGTIFCSGETDEVDVIEVYLTNEDGSDVVLWVTQDAIKLHPINGNINESDEWDWVRKQTPFPTEDRQYIDLVGLTSEERCQLQQLILDYGIHWQSDGNELKPEYCHDEKVVAYTINENTLYVSRSGSFESYEKLVVSRGLKRPIYTKGKDLLGTRINESDGWDWAREIPATDLTEGTYYIDLKGLNSDERCEVQQTLLNAGCLWLDGNDLKARYCKSDLFVAYTIYDGILYTSVAEYKKWSARNNSGGEADYNYIHGKSLIKDNINESDDWDWAREIPNLNNGNYYIDLRTLTPNEKCEVQQLILDAGCLWGNGSGTLDTKYCKSDLFVAYTLKKGTLYNTVSLQNEYKTSYTYIHGKSLINKTFYK